MIVPLPTPLGPQTMRGFNVVVVDSCSGKDMDVAMDCGFGDVLVVIVEEVDFDEGFMDGGVVRT